MKLEARITLVRGIWKYDRSQIGLVYPVITNPIFVLELPWRDNKKGISCIQNGIYKCVRKSSTKNRDWKEAFYIENVNDRENVIFGHIGNDPEDSKGCMLFGLYHDRPNHIKDSRAAIYQWRDAMKPYNEFELEITE